MNQMLVYKQVFYAAEVANILGCSVHRVYNLIHTGQLKAYKMTDSNSWHVTADSIQDYIDSRQQQTVTSPISRSGQNDSK